MTRKTKRLCLELMRTGGGRRTQKDKEEYCGDKKNNRLLQKENETIGEQEKT